MLHQIRASLARFYELFRHRARASAEQRDEFGFHIEMETAENLRRGMNWEEARRTALLRFGGIDRYEEEARDARGVVSIDNLVRDARFALRRLHRERGFAAGVVATLGIGIGAAVGIGTIVYGVLLRDLPFDRPDRLMRVGFVTDGLASSDDLQSEATFYHFAMTARSFTELGVYATSDAFAITEGDAPERITIASVTPSTLTLLGVRPLIGQLLETGDTSWSSGRSAILISESLWRRRYGADPSIIGRSIDIDHGRRNVVGVLPRSFAFPTPAVDVFYPAVIPIKRPQINLRYYNVLGRLRDGVEPAAAEAELRTLTATLSDRFPAITRDMLQQSRARATVKPLKAAMVAHVRSQLMLLGILVAVVLLIATTNVVNLFLLRTDRTRQETAIALSLGASRAALAQRFGVEGLVLGLAAAVVALPIAALAVSTKFGFTEREIPRLHEIGFTSATTALVVGGSMLVGALVGLIGLTQTGVAGLGERLRSSRSTASRALRRSQDGLVAFQIGIALVLLIAGGLLVRSSWNLHHATIGFEPSNAMTFHVSLPWDTYRSYGDHAAFHARVVDRLAALPGVTAVAAVRRLPLANAGLPALELQLQADDDAAPVVASSGNLASPNYFATMEIPLRVGRAFRNGDLQGVPAVILSERTATALFGTTDVVGRQVRRIVRAEAPPSVFTVVGVVGDVHWARIEDGSVPMAYFPLLRDADGVPAETRPTPYEPRDVRYVIRGSPLPSVQTIQRIVREFDRRVPPSGIRTLGSLVDAATARVRLTMLLIATAGVAALVLGVIGVYGVVSYAANGRRREFAIRLALGAAPSHVRGMVLSDGFRPVAIGTFLGLIAALGASKYLLALLYQVEPRSVTEFGISTVLLVGVTLLAALLPARRAARTHPALVLRGE